MRDDEIRALFDSLDAEPRPEFIATLRRQVEHAWADEQAPSRRHQHDGPVRIELEEPLPTQRVRRRRGRYWDVAIALTTVAAVTAVLILVARNRDQVTPADTPTTSTPSVAPASPTTILPEVEALGGRLRAVIPVANTADSIAVNSDAVWVSGWDGSTVARIDAETNEVITVEIDASGARVDVGAGGVWVGDDDGQVTRLDPATAEVIASIEVGTGTATPISGDGAVWVWTIGGDAVSRIDPQTNEVTATVELAVNGLVVGDGTVWALTCDTVTGSGLVSIDSQTLAVSEPIELDDCGSSIGLVDESLWVGLGGRTARVDPTNRRIETILDIGPSDGAPFLTTSDGAVWRPLTTDLIARIDTATNTVVEILDLGRSGQVAGFAVGHGSLWAGDYARRSVLRIDQ